MSKKLDYLAVFLDVVLKHCEANSEINEKYKNRCIKCPFVSFCTLLGTSDVSRFFNNDLNALYSFILSEVKEKELRMYLGGTESVTININQE